MRTFLAHSPLSGLISILFLLSLTLFPEVLPAQDTKVSEKRAELAELKKRIADLQQVMQQRKHALKKEDATLKDVDQRINNINKTIRELDKRKLSLKDELGELRIKKAASFDTLHNEQDVLAQQLRSAYVSGHEEYVKLIMNQQDPSVISRMLVYYRFIAESRVRTIASINTALVRIKKLEKRISQRSHDMDNLLNIEKNRWQSLKQAYQEQSKAVSALRDELSGNAEQIKRMEYDEQELVSLIEKLREIIDELQDEERVVSSFKLYRGELDLPAKGRVVINYGERRQIGNMRWKGVVLAGKLGSDIQALYEGRVVYADWMRGFGLLLIIDHGESYLSLYGHNESVLVEEGDWVERGQTVASMGKSGGSTKPGLYFAIRYKGRAQNPLKWVKR